MTAAALVGSLLVPAAQASASPPGRNGQIAYDRGDPSSPGDTFVFTVNPDGSHASQLVPSHSCCPGWSPDGSKLAIPRLTDDGRVGTATVNADGSDYTPLPINDPTLNIGCGTGSWSPDARRLLCQAWDDSDPARNGLYTINATDGSGLTRITTPPPGLNDNPGSYSPNGKRIVFVRVDMGSGVGVGLFTARADGTRLHQLAAAGSLLNQTADWSPQGNEIVISRHVTSAVRGSIWVVHADGTGLREIHVNGLACGGALADPNSIGCHGPAWSPDGRQLVFVANSATSSDVYTINRDGSGLVQVTHDGGDDPDWGPHPPVG
jgi:Tol biopolymer transport system component